MTDVQPEQKAVGRKFGYGGLWLTEQRSSHFLYKAMMSQRFQRTLKCRTRIRNIRLHTYKLKIFRQIRRIKSLFLLKMKSQLYAKQSYKVWLCIDFMETPTYMLLSYVLSCILHSPNDNQFTFSQEFPPNFLSH